MTETTSAQPASGGERAPFHAASLERIAGELEEVEAALRRLDDGSYGRCVECGAVIAEPSLVQQPLVARCPAHLEGSERPVRVLAGDDALPFAGEDPQG